MFTDLPYLSCQPTLHFARHIYHFTLTFPVSPWDFIQGGLPLFHLLLVKPGNGDLMQSDASLILLMALKLPLLQIRVFGFGFIEEELMLSLSMTQLSHLLHFPWMDL
jgi:hypothetical protein